MAERSKLILQQQHPFYKKPAKTAATAAATTPATAVEGIRRAAAPLPLAAPVELLEPLDDFEPLLDLVPVDEVDELEELEEEVDVLGTAGALIANDDVDMTWDKVSLPLGHLNLMSGRSEVYLCADADLVLCRRQFHGYVGSPSCQ